MDLISVIIPTFNSARWIDRCLDSVLAASDQDTEVIVVDDGSTDDTLKHLERYEAQHSRLIVLREPHRGQGAARKTGFANTSGEWVTFVDSDDTIPHNTFRHYRQLMDDDLDIIIGNVSQRRNRETTFQLSGQSYKMTPKEFSVGTLSRSFLHVLVGKLYRRQVIEQVDWDDDHSLTNQEGAMLLLTIAASMSGNIIVAPEAHTYNYILRSNSQSSMVYLRREGFERMWLKVRDLELPRAELVDWGLRMIYTLFIERGIPIPRGYMPAKDLIQMARGVVLQPNQRHIFRMLRYPLLMKMNTRSTRAKAAAIVNIAPKLSFIIPVYNNASALERTLNSIFNTSFRNIQIVIVDDGSDDRTKIRLQMLYTHYRRITLVRHTTNHGVAMARLSGLKAATGEMVMFVDAGDKIARDGIFDSIMKIQSGFDIVAFGMRIFSDNFGFSWRFYLPTVKMAAAKGSDKEIFDKILSRRDCFPSMCNLLIRRTAITTSDLEYQGIVYGEDMLARLSLHARGLKMGYVDKVGYLWATGGSSHRAAAEQWRLETELAHHILNERKRFNLTPSQRRVVAETLTYNLALIYAGEYAKPWSSNAKLARAITNGLAMESVQKIYADAGEPMPNADAVIANARQLASRHRRAFLFKVFFKF